MWEAIQYITSGLSLLAFVVAVIAWVYKNQSEERERLIKATSEDRRTDLVRSALEFFDVSTEGLTKEQKYELALAQIHARAQRFRTTAIVVCALAAILAGLSAYAISRADVKKVEPVEERQSKERVFDSRGSSKISLLKSTDWNFPNDAIQLRGTIVTNGNALTIKARKLVAVDARIAASERSSAVVSALNGEDGATGTGGAGAGQSGGRGGDATAGANGKPGFSPDAVIVEVGGFEGKLSISTSGGDGQNGGRGGRGGAGGAGGRGEASQPGVLDCAAGPGWGGSGGGGGAAGKGGNGGAGGSAATISFTVKETFTGVIEADAKGGRGGQAGVAGQPGEGGAGGAEGEVRGRCQSAGRNGAVGPRGASAVAGTQGLDGHNARISVDLPKLTTEAVGEYRHDGR